MWEVEPTSFQMIGYALLILKKYNFDGDIVSTVIQHNTVKTVNITAFVKQFEDYLIELLEDITPKMGEQCIYCPALLECKKVNKLIDKVLEEKDSKMNLEHLKYYKIIDKYINDLKLTFIENYPDRVNYSYRNTKTWVDKPTDVKYMQTVSPSKALKLGYKGGGIKTIQTKVLKGFNLDGL